MKSKSSVVALSFLFGSTGAPRFYLGQNQSGWTILLIWWLALPAAVYGILKFDLASGFTSLYGNKPFLQIGLMVIIVFHLIETIRFMVMSPEKFKSQDRSTRNTFPLTILSIILGAALSVTSSNLLNDIGHVDITKTEADAILSSAEMSQEFRRDEVAYRKKYDNKVIQVEGPLSLSPGEDFETGTIYLELSGADSDAFGIKCFFLKENSANVKGIVAGDSVVVKGECSGNILNNCLLIQVKKKL